MIPATKVIKRYKNNFEGKKAFVEEVLSPLLTQANTGWYWGCHYEYEPGIGEYVYIHYYDGSSAKRIDVGADSLEAIVLDVFKNL